MQMLVILIVSVMGALRLYVCVLTLVYRMEYAMPLPSRFNL